MNFVIRSDWPAIAILTAMDVWQIACYVTVFASVGEFVLVIYLTKLATWEENLIKEKKIGILNGKYNPKVSYIIYIKCRMHLVWSLHADILVGQSAPLGQSKCQVTTHIRYRALCR